MIHPTAVIDPKAKLDSDAVVGPHFLIESKVRIGSGTEIHGHAVNSGQKVIGRDNRVGYQAINGSFPQDLSLIREVCQALYWEGYVRQPAGWRYSLSDPTTMSIKTILDPARSPSPGVAPQLIKTNQEYDNRQPIRF